MLFSLSPNCTLTNTATAKEVPFKFSKREVVFIFVLSGLASGFLTTTTTKNCRALKADPKVAPFLGQVYSFPKCRKQRKKKNRDLFQSFFAEIICIGTKPNTL